MTTIIIDNIKQARIQAMKDKDEVTKFLLTTVMGEANMKGKNDGDRPSTDKDYIQVMNKFVDNINDTLDIFEKNPVVKEDEIKKRALDKERLNKEKSILISFLPELPAQMTTEQIEQSVQGIVNELGLAGPKAISVVMKEMKARFEGAYDAGMTSQIAKKVLQ